MNEMKRRNLAVIISLVQSDDVIIHYIVHCKNGKMLQSAISNIDKVVGTEMVIENGLNLKVVTNQKVTKMQREKMMKEKMMKEKFIADFHKKIGSSNIFFILYMNTVPKIKKKIL